jgi:hypothetical protein
VAVKLSDVQNWSAANAAQVVGLQWQFTSPPSALDASAADPDAAVGCPIDVTVTDIKFLP